MDYKIFDSSYALELTRRSDSYQKEKEERRVRISRASSEEIKNAHVCLKKCFQCIAEDALLGRRMTVFSGMHKGLALDILCEKFDDNVEMASGSVVRTTIRW